MSEKVAFVYWCDGAGHAARSIPVLKELESRGVEVSVAGGGSGKKFVEMNGYDHPGLTQVTVEGDNPISFLKHSLFDIVPSSIKRMREVSSWLKREDPDKLITDDVFACAAAAAQGIEFYRIDHLTPDLLRFTWRIPAKIYNSASLVFGEKIIVTSLWKDEKSPEGITRVGPLAQEGESDEEIDEYDVLMNPGSHGENFEEIKERLEEKNMDVRVVGDNQWETKPSMTPYTEKAEVVICTGFSSIADTVVAGTCCVVYPFLPFQEDLAKGIEERNLEGLETAYSVDEAVKATVNMVRENEKSPKYENGAEEFVDCVMD